jgi:hypothetical protein
LQAREVARDHDRSEMAGCQMRRQTQMIRWTVKELVSGDAYSDMAVYWRQ